MYIVIADDITGAAELAGLALRYGLKTVLTTDVPAVTPDADVLVIATDTRSMSDADAYSTVCRITKEVQASCNRDFTLFKKTDSVLRGHIVTEIKAIADTTEYKGALLLAQNPSKGRTIKHGTYYIDGVPLCDTKFRDDPEFPALSSSVEEILKANSPSVGAHGVADFSGLVHVADAECEEDIEHVLTAMTDCLLPAGGADFFEHLLKKATRSTSRQPVSSAVRADVRHALIVCGSTQSRSLMQEPFIRAIGAGEELMPDDVFTGGAPDDWFRHLEARYVSCGSLIAGIGQRENAGKECALRLKEIMAEAVQHLVGAAVPDLIIIEGGATAYSVLSRLDWRALRLHREYAPGVVGMMHGTTEVILKPGSYPWGNLFER